MKKLIFIFSLFFISFNTFAFFEEWSEWNRKNREEVYNFFTGNVNKTNNTSINQPPIDLENPKITFKDIIGGVPQEILDLKKFLEDDATFRNLGAKKPKGILFTGPPGCGKTMLAKAIAGEMNAEFISTSAASFVELFVGSGPLKVREIFKKAEDATKGNKKAIIFIDEIDALGKRESRWGGSDESNKTINEILVQLDGFNKNNNITVIAATNWTESLDSALLRPGRFDYIIEIPLPDLQKRLAIIKHYLYENNRKIDSKIDINEFAKKTEYFNCAELNDLVNKAVINAVNNKRSEVKLEDLQKSFEEVKLTKTRYRNS